MKPTPEGFLEFVRGVMGVPTSALPDASPYIQGAFDASMETVHDGLAARAPLAYTSAVYNLGGSILVNVTPDPSDAPVYKDDLKFFAYFRREWKIFDFVAGVVSSTGDEGTNTSLEVPEAMKGLTLSDLQRLKDPYGREYLRYAQAMGPSVVGIS